MAGLCEGGNEPPGSLKASKLCDMYSNQELAEIHFMYGKADGNAALARRLYQERYPQRQCPDRKTFETLRGHSDSSFRGEGYIQCCVGVRLWDMYSNQELAEIHFMYGKADGNAALARRLYQERYPQRQCPDRKTFVRLHLKSLVYSSAVPDLESLRSRIVACSEDIRNTPGVWDRVRRLCDMYSNQELAEIHFMYGKADGNAALARRLYQERYPQRQCPDRKTFVRLHLKSLVYSSAVPDLESLRSRIVACSEDIRNTPGVWDRVRRSMRHRCEVCIQAGGGHFEHLL
ncbi:hypothetical protein ANN_26360 [Periplaneta americana]|uniref:DUF4817 domain-containing protein n=1 Tax=Periplaneta americana TaxID=6978 RepID=A0ABQ8RY39_PERAM|nr:hypothetical protein ANN_26360 [Periplaneta americana]